MKCIEKLLMFLFTYSYLDSVYEFQRTQPFQSARPPTFPLMVVS